MKQSLAIFVWIVVLFAAARADDSFLQQVRPLLDHHCLVCHNADEAQSGVRLDGLSDQPDDRQLFLWQAVRKQIDSGAMPPAEEPQPSAEERQATVAWIDRMLDATLRADTRREGTIRRLTAAQYVATLRELLDLEEDLSESLPPDAPSKSGFLNQEQASGLSPAQVEAYFDTAAKALDRCVVDPAKPPTIQRFRMELGRSIHPDPPKEPLVLGAFSELLPSADFVVTEPPAEKPFPFRAIGMQKSFRFIEGYVGNDTIREWRDFQGIHHAVFACLRGTPGYPKGEAVKTIPQGLLLRPAIPSTEIFGQSNTYGPMANFKIALRDLPQEGSFRIRVQAARYDDGLLLNADDPPSEDAARIDVDLSRDERAVYVNLPEAGVWQVDWRLAAGESKGLATLVVGEREFSAVVPSAGADAPARRTAFLIARLPAGETSLALRAGEETKLNGLALTKLAENSPLAKRFATFEKRSPWLGVHLGLRRDCGSALTRVGAPLEVDSTELREYTFAGAIADFPSPDVEPDNVNYLAGVREIAVRSEHTDGRDLPRLLVKSIEFEGPYYETWPPASHRRIFIDTEHRDDPPRYAREIIRSFATRAFRRPVADEEEATLFQVFERSFAESADFRASVKDALAVTLASPQFVFLIEASQDPNLDDLDDYELASKLSYFLWNGPPDEPLLAKAASHTLRTTLDEVCERVIADPRFDQGMQAFVPQWLSLEKLDSLSPDASRFPRLTREAKAQLRREPVEWVRHVVRENLPIASLVRADQVLVNDTVADYYDLGARSESGFRFQPLSVDGARYGGLLSQAGILAALSDGREANPVKRGAWVARKIVSEPPDDPPPNVPQLPKDDESGLTLRQKIEKHRSQPGCAGCHQKIDPWGMPFERFDAGGRFHDDPNHDPSSRLPDGTEVADLTGLKDYLADRRAEQIAFSFAKHVATYAVGRDLRYRELALLREEVVKLRSRQFPARDLVRLVVASESFLKK